MDRDGRSTTTVEVVLRLRRTAPGRTVVDVSSATSPVSYGTVELGELPLLLEAVLVDLGRDSPG